MAAMSYADFSLGIEHAGEARYLVRAFTPDTEAESPTELPFGSKDLSGLLTRLASSAASSLTDFRELDGPVGTEVPSNTVAFGRVLFKILFPGEVGELYSSQWNSATKAGLGLRISLHLRPRNPLLAWLSRVPWELMYDDRSGGFPCLNPLNPLIRHLDLPRPAERTPFHTPIRVLVAAANPSGVSKLDLAGEQEKIAASSGRRKQIEVEVFKDASPEGLRRKLARGDYQIIHFMGHGLVEEEDGSLVFVTPEGHPCRVTGQEMSQLVQATPTARLVILNACRTAAVPEADEADPLAGVAAALVRGGQPAVIGMQFSISDEAALKFSEVLYERLAEGDHLETAVAEARLAVYLTTSRPADWAAPVLFLRGAEKRLLSALTEKQVQEADRGTTPMHEVRAKAEDIYAKNIVVNALDLEDPNDKVPDQSTKASLDSKTLRAEETLSIAAIRIRRPNP